MEKELEKGDIVYILCPSCKFVGFNPSKCVVCSHKFSNPEIRTILKENNEVYDLTGLNISYPRYPPVPKKKQVHHITSEPDRQQHASSYFENSELFKTARDVILKQQSNEETEEQKRRKKCSFGTYWKYCSRCNPELCKEHRNEDGRECTEEDLKEGIALKIKSFQQVRKEMMKKKIIDEKNDAKNVDGSVHHHNSSKSENESKDYNSLKQQSLSDLTCNAAKTGGKIKSKKKLTITDITSQASNKISDTIDVTCPPMNVTKVIDKSVALKTQNRSGITSQASNKILPDTIDLTCPPMNVTKVIDKSVASKTQNRSDITPVASNKTLPNTSVQTHPPISVTNIAKNSGIHLKSKENVSNSPIFVHSDIIEKSSCDIKPHQKAKSLDKNEDLPTSIKMQVPTNLSSDTKKINLDAKNLKSTKNDDDKIAITDSSKEVSSVPTSEFFVKKEVNLDVKNLDSPKNENKISTVTPASLKEFSQDEINVDVKHLKSTKDEDKIITDMQTSSEEFSEEMNQNSNETKSMDDMMDVDYEEILTDEDDDIIIISEDEDSQEVSGDSNEDTVSVKDNQVPTSEIFVQKKVNLDAKHLDSVKNQDKISTVIPASLNEFSQSTELANKNFKYPEVEEEDLKSLDECAYINDTIIEFYLNFIYNEKLSFELQEKTYICNTQFYKKLLEEEAHWCKTGKAPEKTVEDNWLKNVDLFSKDYIIIPMLYSGNHWYLVIICFLSKLYEMPGNGNTENKEDISHNTRTRLKEQQKLENSQKPCICFFDSSDYPGELSEDKLKVAKTLKNYLKSLRVRQKNAQSCDWGRLTFKNVNCPQQENGYDCGVFLLQFAECFFKTPITSFENTPDVMHWFKHEDIKDNRKKIRKIILEIKDKVKKNRISSASSCKP